MLEKLGPKIIELINQNEWTDLLETIADLLPQEIADISSSISDEKNKYKFFKLLSSENKIKVFPYLENHFQQLLFKKLPLKIKVLSVSTLFSKAILKNYETM